MRGQIKSFGPNRPVTFRSKRRSRIYEKSMKQYSITQTNMCRPAVDKVNHRENFGLLMKGASKPNHVPAPKGMTRPTTASSFRKLLIPTVNANDRSKETHASKRKGDVNDVSHPTQLKAMPGLVPKTSVRLGHYPNSLSQLANRASSDKEEDITSAKYSTIKLESSKGTCMVAKNSCTTKGNERQDTIAIDKQDVKEFGEYHKDGDTMKATNTLDSILSDIHCVSKKRKGPLFEENPKALNDDTNVGAHMDNMSCKQMKKLKQSRVTRKDEAEEGGGNLNHVSVEDDVVSLSKNGHAEVSMSSCVGPQCYSCSKPIDKPAWSGIFKTNNNKYVSLVGHLSTKSCEKAWDLSRQLLKVVEVEKLSRSEVWPKEWEVLTPNGNDIGIYFFPHEMRQDEGLDKLVREVMDNDMALQAIVGEAEMLIFPSILLPNHYQTFQRKHYLWGVFKRRQDRSAMVEELNAMGHCEKEKQQNLVLDHPNHKLSFKGPNQDMNQMPSTMPLERHKFPPNKSTQEDEARRLKGPTKKGFDLKAPGEEGQAKTTCVSTNAATFPASLEQINPSMGHTPDSLMGFVVRKTPKLDQIIREIEREGALVFAMQGEMVCAGS